MKTTLSPRDLLPHPDRAALLVIDVQERLAPAMHVGQGLPDVLRNAGILIQVAREFSLPLLVSEQYPKGLGPTLTELLDLLPEGCTPVSKTSFSCCGEPSFAPHFDSIAGRDIILCGMETHVCVLQTALDLLEQGRRVYVAADAVASRTALNWHTGLELMRQAGAIIGTTEVFAFGLLRAAGTEQFKRISRMVK